MTTESPIGSKLSFLSCWIFDIRMATVCFLAQMSSYEAGKLAGTAVGVMLVLGIVALFVVAISQARRSTGWRVTAIVIGILGGLSILGSVAKIGARASMASRKAGGAHAVSATKSISSAGEEVTMTVPSGWQPLKGQQGPLLSYVLVSEEKCLFVAGVSKTDFTGSLSDYQKLNQENLRVGMPQLKFPRIESKAIGEYPAIRWEVTGEVNGIPSCYRLATVETEDHFYLITTSSTQERAAASAEGLDRIIESFTAKAGPPAAVESQDGVR